MIGGSGSGKTSSLFNVISYLPDIKSNEVKYQFLINKRVNLRLKHLNDSKAFIEYSNDMDDIYKNVEE